MASRSFGETGLVVTKAAFLSDFPYMVPWAGMPAPAKRGNVVAAHPVVPTRLIVDGRGAAHFAEADDQGIVEQAPGLEVVQQRRDAAWLVPGSSQPLHALKWSQWVSQPSREMSRPSFVQSHMAVTSGTPASTRCRASSTPWPNRFQP